MIIPEEDVTFSMEEFFMLSLTINANLKLTIGILFGQSVIDNKLTDGLIFIRERVHISLNIETRELAHFLRCLIILKVWLLTYQ